ncbi:MAG: thiamine-phosphate kinase, partial [Candidatus Margulisiibacteriota bacterium]
MKLSQIGEFGLIEQLNHQFSTIVGIGDDCAVVEILNLPCHASRQAGRQAGSKHQILNKSKSIKSKYQLITTDALVEGVHFDLKKCSFYDVGYKAMLVNISDIAAMGGYPAYAVVSIALPQKIKVEDAKEIYRGMDRLARKHKIDIVGGDTVSSKRDLFISITLIGEVEKDCLVKRSGAKVGDKIYVTGHFGRMAPVRLKEGRDIAKAKLASSMIDSSDGLVLSVREIARQSKVGARIYMDKVPVAAGATLDQALYGGEDYELVFTSRKKLSKKYKMVGEIVK